MTTVFSLVTIGLALGISVFIGGTYLQPSLDIAKVMAGVAYDIASLYDIAYTMPGEVTMKYYGPAVCMWNTAQDPNSAKSFHCFSGEAVVIDDVQLDRDLLLMYNDTYVRFDYERCMAEGGSFCIPTDVYLKARPAYGLVRIPFFNAQLCSYSGSGFSNCDEAVAPFAASYLDYSFATDQVQSVRVEDYSFIVEKKNVETFYQTVSQTPETPTSLITLIQCLALMYDDACTSSILTIPTEMHVADILGGGGQTCIRSSTESTPLKLREGYRWHVYNNETGEPTIICQERLSLMRDFNINNESYLIVDGNTMRLNNYTIEYCFDINNFRQFNPCPKVPKVRITSEAVSAINNYEYYAGSVSCVNPIIVFRGDELVLDVGRRVRYSPLLGGCQNV